MDKKLPSMTALLGLLAIAGYQNRDRLAELMRGRQGAAGGANDSDAGEAADGAGLGGLLRSAGSGGLGGLLSGGLSELIDRFKLNGKAEIADSWVGRGPNKEIAPPDLERAIGPDVLDELTEQTGLSRSEILARLSQELPQAVDKYTPDGRIPDESDFRST